MGRSKLEMYSVTPFTLGSSNDSTTRVSLNTRPEPCRRAIVRDSAAVALDGEDDRMAADVARKVERAPRREVRAGDASVVLSRGSAAMES